MGNDQIMLKGEQMIGGCQAAAFSTKRWDNGTREGPIESAAPLQLQSSDGTLLGINLCPADCSGSKVIGLHNCSIKSSRFR